jgi:pyruvate dehydrogenase E1 component alpha subunit
MPGVRVDGNNVIEVYLAAKTAVQNARGGRGPALIECMTYRWRGHVGPHFDLDKGLRSQEELDLWMSKCPIKALEKQLLSNNIISESEINEIYQNVIKEVEDSVSFARESPYPDSSSDFVSDVFKSV